MKTQLTVRLSLNCIIDNDAYQGGLKEGSSCRMTTQEEPIGVTSQNNQRHALLKLEFITSQITR